jgi:hypothetical protein
MLIADDVLAREKAYLRDHQAELAEKFPGKYLVIQGETIYGAYETYDQGVNEGVALLGVGPFLVRSVLQPDDEVVNVPALSVGVPLVVNS